MKNTFISNNLISENTFYVCHTILPECHRREYELENVHILRAAGIFKKLNISKWFFLRSIVNGRPAATTNPNPPEAIKLTELKNPLNKPKTKLKNYDVI